jgi:membrane protein
LLFAALSATGDAPAPAVNSPADIPARGWRLIAVRVWKAFNRDNISIIAAGVSFNIVLGIFPALAAVVALYGLVADAGDAPRHIAALAVLLPADVVKALGDEMVRLAIARPGGLSLTLAIGLMISLWSANGAMKAIMVGLNVAYETSEKRGFVTHTLVSLASTVGLLMFMAVVVAALGAGSVASAFLGPRVGSMIDLLRWPFLLFISVGALCLLYRFGPCRPFARWRWITWGSAAATVTWLGASAVFSIYLSRFAHLGRTYGSVATAIALMLWIWLSVAIVLAGAELNAEIERESAAPPRTKRRDAKTAIRPRAP